MKDKVVIAISGGVDSSVAALLLKEQRHEVVGITMCLGVTAEVGGHTKCCGPREIEDARRVCQILEIPHYTMDFSGDLEEHIVRTFIEEYARGRTPNPCVMRQFSAHLRAGGAVLTFHSGKIEPDPDVHPGALESLQDLTDSSAVFLRFAPGLQIVPVLVSGVIWERTARHWLTRLKQKRDERERLAAALQLLAMLVRNARPTTVHVQFGRPITRQDTCSMGPGCVHKVLMERMRFLIEHRGSERGVPVL